MRRALLLGCPGPGLSGVEADVAAMTALLDRYAFTDTSPLLGGTRDAILAAIRGLIDRSAPGDAVVLYYSGHGWRVDVPADRRRGGSADFQGIAPADLHATTATDFRGILADELTGLIDELTEKTANVTVILDCCHATGAVRSEASPSPRPGLRALPVPWTIQPAELVASLRARGLVRERRDPETNPLAVRLFACRPHEQASEDPRQPGGLLTRALVAALAACDHGDVVWEDLGRSVDARVRAIKPAQHPVVVGPARRRLFSLETRTRDGATATFARDGAQWIVGGALLDHRPGDRFVAVPPTRADGAPVVPLARLELTQVHHQLGRASVDRPPPDGATVLPSFWGTPRAAVTLSVDPARRATFAAAISASGRLAIADTSLPHIADTSLPHIADVADAPGGLAILGPSRQLLRAVATLDAACLALDLMAQADALRRLQSVAPLDPQLYELAWSRVDTGEPLATGAAVPRGVQVTATATNRGPTPLFVSLFAVEADGRISLLTRSQPAGVELVPGATYRLGEDRQHGVRGVALCHPSSRREPWPVTLVAFVLELAIPLAAWETTLFEGPSRGDAATVSKDFPQHPIRYTVAAIDLTAI
jgi:hypothetical protein